MSDVRTAKKLAYAIARRGVSVCAGFMASVARNPLPRRSMDTVGDTGGARYRQRDRHQDLEALQGHALLREGVHE